MTPERDFLITRSAETGGNSDGGSKREEGVFPESNVQQVLEYSQKFIAALDARENSTDDAVTLAAGIAWIKSYARRVVEKRIERGEVVPTNVRAAYYSDHGGEITGFARDVDGVVMKIHSLLPQTRLFTAENSPALRTHYNEEKFVSDMVSEFKTRMYAGMGLMCEEEDKNEDGEFVPDEATEKYVEALGTSYGTMLFNLVFDSAIDTSNPEVPVFADMSVIQEKAYSASKKWIAQEIGDVKAGATQLPGSLLGVAQEALSRINEE